MIGWPTAKLHNLPSYKTWVDTAPVLVPRVRVVRKTYREMQTPHQF